jgi:GntR family transcriptional regulator
MSVDPNSHVPIYQQIMAHIRHRIAAGVYRAGEGLPSIRTLALKLVVNPNTVQRAYQELEREGLVFSRKGLGLFVTKHGARAARNRSESAVYDRFAEGIRTGRASNMDADQISGTFRKAMDETFAKTDADAP